MKYLRLSIRAPVRRTLLSILTFGAFASGALAASETPGRIGNDSMCGNDTVGRAMPTAARTLSDADSSTAPPRSSTFDICGTLGGNLPKIVASCGKPYLVTADVYVPPGKTVRIEPGAVLLFKNFTGIHVEGKLLAEGTAANPIIFSSEFDRTYNPGTALHANPFDWNGIYIHEGGLGSSMTHCMVRYSVYGVNSLTKYIKLDKTAFQDNGRSDCAIEGIRHAAGAGPITYALTLDDARKDGIPVRILMDPMAKKRAFVKYGGLSLMTGGCFMAIYSAISYRNDKARFDALSNNTFTGPESNIIVNSDSDWRKAQSDRNLDFGLTAAGVLGAAVGAAGFAVSFTF